MQKGQTFFVHKNDFDDHIKHDHIKNFSWKGVFYEENVFCRGVRISNITELDSKRLNNSISESDMYYSQWRTNSFSSLGGRGGGKKTANDLTPPSLSMRYHASNFPQI